MAKTELSIISVQTQKKWRDWLLKNQTKSNCIWLRIYKKNSGVKSVNRNQALEKTLCFGWIDRQGKSYNEQSHLQKFTPRHKNSVWSKAYDSPANMQIPNDFLEELSKYPEVLQFLITLIRRILMLYPGVCIQRKKKKQG